MGRCRTFKITVWLFAVLTSGSKRCHYIGILPIAFILVGLLHCYFWLLGPDRVSKSNRGMAPTCHMGKIRFCARVLQFLLSFY